MIPKNVECFLNEKFIFNIILSIFLKFSLGTLKKYNFLIMFKTSRIEALVTIVYQNQLDATCFVFPIYNLHFLRKCFHDNSFQ